MAASRSSRPATPPAKRLDPVVATLTLVLVVGTALLVWFLELVF